MSWRNFEENCAGLVELGFKKLGCKTPIWQKSKNDLLRLIPVTPGRIRSAWHVVNSSLDKAASTDYQS